MPSSVALCLNGGVPGRRWHAHAGLIHQVLEFLEQKQCKVQDLVTDTTRQSPTEPMLFHLVRAEKKSRSRETALTKTDEMINRLLLPHERFFSSLVFAIVATALRRLAVERTADRSHPGDGIDLTPVCAIAGVHRGDPRRRVRGRAASGAVPGASFEMQSVEGDRKSERDRQKKSWELGSSEGSLR